MRLWLLPKWVTASTDSIVMIIKLRAWQKNKWMEPKCHFSHACRTETVTSVPLKALWQVLTPPLQVPFSYWPFTHLSTQPFIPSVNLFRASATCLEPSLPLLRKLCFTTSSFLYCQDLSQAHQLICTEPVAAFLQEIFG